MHLIMINDRGSAQRENLGQLFNKSKPNFWQEK